MVDLTEELEREAGSHKCENGKVGVIAGSKDFSGAPALSAKAALRTGCDLVKILTSEQVADIVAGYSENFIVEGYSGGCFNQKSVEKALKLDKWADVVVVGPGLSKPDGNALEEFMQKADSDLIIDAEAVDVASESGIEGVYTPHKGELESILSVYGSERKFVEDTGSVLAVKGSVDKLYSGSGEQRLDVGTPAMTVGGTGDVLTGIIASLISQGLSGSQAAELGLSVNGKAGEKAEKEFGNGLLATDIIERIPDAI